jgi:hypothetical protein
MKDIKQFKSERWRMNLGGANVLNEKPKHRLVNGLAKAKTQNPTFYFLTFSYFLHHINHFYYYSNKKITTNFFFFFHFPYQIFLLFHFSKKKKSILTFFHINQFLLQYQTETETKSFIKRTPRLITNFNFIHACVVICLDIEFGKLRR